MAPNKLAACVLLILLTVNVAGISATTLEPNGVIVQGKDELSLEVPTWEQVNDNGFGDQQAGEVSALEAFNGFLYAGTYNPIDDARIFRSPDGVIWTPVTEPGFGNSHDIAPPAILDLAVFNGRLYASTGRGNASQLWRTLNGLIWAPMDVTGFSDPNNVDITALVEYGGKIYAGVTNQVSGAQIWSSFTGDNNSWTQVAPTTPGIVAASVTGFAVYDGGLYAAIEFESEAPVQIWRSYGGPWEIIVNDGFGDSNTAFTGGMTEFDGSLYVGAGNTASGAQLWRTNNGTTWQQVITPAFGDSNNHQVELVYLFQNQLYTSVKNEATGIETWRSADGSLWEQVNPDGFGDSNNTSSNWSNAAAEFLGQLYLGTSNVVDGGELWRMQNNVADLTLSKIDKLDPVTLGDPIHYELIVSNAGPETAQNVVLTDNLTAGVSYVSATTNQGTCVNGSGIVTCNLGNLPNGGNFNVEIIVTSLTPGIKTNQASVTSDTADANIANNAADETTLVGLKTFLPTIIR